MLKKISILSLMAAAVASQAAGVSSYIYGLAKQGGIYKIDTATGDSTLITATQIVNTQGGTNGLAFDGTSFYYNNTSTSKLIKSTSGAETVLKSGFSANANATYYNGKYMYISSSQTLNGVDVANPSSVSSVAYGGRSKSYGDMVISSTGAGIASVDNVFQSFSLNGALNSTHTNSMGGQLQLGYDQNGKLFGVSYSSGQIYQIDTTTYALTAKGVAHAGAMTLNINDAASAQPVPEPASMLALAGGAAALLRKRRKSA